MQLDVLHGVNLPKLVFEQTAWKHGHHTRGPFSENEGKSATEGAYNKEKVLRRVEKGGEDPVDATLTYRPLAH